MLLKFKKLKVFVFIFCLYNCLLLADINTDYSTLSTEQLLKEGERLIEIDSLENRAASIFNIIVNRYYYNQTDPQIRHAATVALRHLGNINMTHNIDYRQAYRNLHLARQIAEDDKNDFQLAFILNSLAALYTSNNIDNDSIAGMAKKLLLESLEKSLISNNHKSLSTVGINIAFDNFVEGNWGIYNEAVHKIENIKFTSENSNNGEIAKLVIKATDAFFSNHYDLSENLFKEALEIQPQEKYSERLSFTLNIFLIELYLKQLKYNDAINKMINILNEAEISHNTDYERIILYKIAKTYDELGQTDSVEKYYTRYLNLKDIMRVNSGFGEIDKLDFLSEIEHTNKELENLSIRHQKEHRNLLLTINIIIILTIVFIALLFIYIKLKRVHKNLFIRNEETLKREKQDKLLREKLEKEKIALEKEIESIQSEKYNSNNKNVLSSSDYYDSEENNNLIEEEDKETLMKIYSNLLKVMEENPDIYQSGFSLPDLASLAGFPTRSVSRAINVFHNTNFHQFLNDFRIREVIRLMHDSQTRNLTIEAIAEKAGFKSRSSFSKVFKNIVGLPPSEYVRMINEEK